jgi:2-(1,2-epoxy-1,2-dihydrophenyl)acetyl-CoA isomerase
MADLETLLISTSGAVRTITLNRPERCNAFTEAMHRELGAALKDAGGDASVRAVILTGSGKAFCSGQDLKEVQEQPGRNLGDSLRKNYNPNIRRLRALEKPVIAALNGVAAGAGFSLALACDLRLAAASASFTEVFVHVGLIPDSGSTWFLPRLVGYHRAFDLCSTGRKIGAEEALRLNLVDEVLPDEALFVRAQELAARYTEAPAKAIALLKRALNHNAAGSLDAALDYEAQLQEICGGSEDYREGVAAFIEKRKPRYTGR